MVSKRGKRRLVVAAARRLAIDLWRWATGRAPAQELGLQFQLTRLRNQAFNAATTPIWERRDKRSSSRFVGPSHLFRFSVDQASLRTGK